MSKLEIFSAIFIIIAAGYWYFFPAVNVEPIIIIASSVFMLIGSLSTKFPRNKILKATLNKPFSFTLKSCEIRCYTEDIDYGIKLDYELFFNKKILLKNIILKYKEPHEYGENQSQRSKIFYIKYLSNDLLKQDMESMINILKASEQMQTLPSVFDEKTLLQLTIAGYIPGKRVQDGWEGVTLNNWTLSIEIDNSDVYEIPVIFTKHADTLKRPIKWEEIGFIKTENKII